jgi:hypothetical protein
MPVRPLLQFGSPTTEALLRRNGLASLDAIFAQRSAAQVRHVGRAVRKTELQGTGGVPVTAFVKLSWGRRRWWPRISDIRTGQVLKSLAIREWEGLDALERLGIRVPERLAILEEGLLWKRSAIILKAVPPPASVSDMILDGSWLTLPGNDREAILRELARTLVRIHGSGWAWRSISTRHVFPQRDAGGGWELWLIDCEGVHRARSAKLLLRDLRRFIRALIHDRADDQTVDTMRSIASQFLTGGAANEGVRSRAGRSAA